MPAVTVVIPAYNEEDSIREVVVRVASVMAAAKIVCEIVVVVDGATDRTASEAETAGARIVEHPQNRGYGRSLKTGILAATHDLIAITDADGTYPVERLPEMISLSSRFHMVVGARTGRYYQSGLLKRLGRLGFRWLSEFAAGQHIPDINSGLRVLRRQEIVPFFGAISSGFSFTTTCTLAYLLNDLFVHYVSIEYRDRTGQSKVRHLRDSFRALQIVVEAILRYNPIKVFILLAMPFATSGLLLLIWGLLVRSHWLYLGAIVCASTAGLVVGMGFLAVAVSNRSRFSDRVMVPPLNTSQAGENHE